MSNPDIPVEVRLAAMRANADLLDEHHNHHGAHLLRAEAAQIERDAFVDELARLFYATETRAVANLIDGIDYPQYDEREEAYREGTRAGIRAVLAKLEETRDTDAEADQIETENKPLRQWEDLNDAPNDVFAVRDRNGIELVRTYSLDGGHRWKSRDGRPHHIHSPFTEIRQPEAPF